MKKQDASVPKMHNRKKWKNIKNNKNKCSEIRNNEVLHRKVIQDFGPCTLFQKSYGALENV